MPFYVSTMELSRLSGRSKGGIGNAKRRNQLPYMEVGGNLFYDIDDPILVRYMGNLPNNLGAAKKAAIKEYQADFLGRRSRGEAVCAVTGKVDTNSEAVQSLRIVDDEELDQEKKRKDIEYRERQIEKLDVTMLAMKGGLIEREYVSTWIQRYLGTLHTQHLELSTTGVCDDLYSAAHRLKDSRGAIKEMEKILANACAEILKGAIATMEKNPV